MQHALARTLRRSGADPRTWLTAPILALALAVGLEAQTTAEPTADPSGDAVTISHGVSNFGELRYGPDMAHLDYVNPDAPKGGEISLWSQGTFDSFNIYTRQGVPGANTTIMYESILVSTADDAYGAYCYLCTTIEYPENRDWVIFNLRDDVTFADGTPMTAEDVAFSFNLFLEQGIVEYRDVFAAFLDEVEVLGPHRIRFTFTENAPRREVITFAGGTPVFSRAWFEETDARLDEATDVPFLGTGPYVLDSYESNRNIVYGRNPNFWGAEHPFNIGRHNFDRVRVEYFADAAAALEAFKAGEYTFRIENSSKEWATSYDFPGIDNGWVRKEELPDGNIGLAQSFVFNLRDPKFQDPRLREAIRLMFNFEWSNQTLFYGLYERVNSFWENSPLEATGVPTEAEAALLQPLVDDGLLDASILTAEPVMAPVNSADTNTPGREVYARALELLAEAGWVEALPPRLPPILAWGLGAVLVLGGVWGLRSKGAGGAGYAALGVGVAAGAACIVLLGLPRAQAPDGKLRNAEGTVLSVTFLERSPAFDRIINPYVENLQRLGVDAELERVDPAQYTARRRPPVDFDIVNQSFSMGFEPGVDLEQWFASRTAEDSSRNLMALQSEAVDRLLPAVAQAETLDELTTAVHALDRVLRAEGFWVPQWYKDRHTVAYYDMYRYPETLPPFDLGVLSFWWFDADRAAELRAAGAL